MKTVEELHHRLGEAAICMFVFGLLTALLQVPACTMIFGAAIFWKACVVTRTFWDLWKFREMERRSGVR